MLKKHKPYFQMPLMEKLKIFAKKKPLVNIPIPTPICENKRNTDKNEINY